MCLSGSKRVDNNGGGVGDGSLVGTCSKQFSFVRKHSGRRGKDRCVGVGVGVDVEDKALVRMRRCCLVEVVVGQGQATTILFLTLEVANSRG